jgi:uncharacterized protein YkwD
MLYRTRVVVLLAFWSWPPLTQDQPRGGANRSPDLDQAARLIIEQTNGFRRDEKRLPLKTSPPLEATARDFAAFMARTDKYAHDADGNHPEDRVKQHGYEYCIVAENIAYEFNSGGFETAELARKLMEGWKNSPGHRKNLLHPDLMELGVALAHSEHSGKYYAVQVFGRPKSAEITFQIVNNSGAKISYKLDGESEILEPRLRRTLQVCSPLTLSFPATAEGGLPQSFRPAKGDQFLVTQKNGKLSVRKQSRDR